MPYNPPIRGRLKKSTLTPSPFQFANEVGSVSLLVQELRILREDLVLTANRELDKVEDKLADIDSKIESLVTQEIEKIDEKLSSVDFLMEEVAEIVKGVVALGDRTHIDKEEIIEAINSQIKQPKDGKDADKEEIVREVLAKLSIPNEKDIIKKVMKLIPESKSSLKVIREELQLDKEALLDELIKSPKLKLKIENVDGLDKMLKTLDRRYIHGGGFSNIADVSGLVTSGLDTLKFIGSGVSSVTKTGNTVTVEILGGSGTYTVLSLVSGDIDDTNTTFTFSGTPTGVIINGQTYFAGQTAGGTIMWTNAGVVVTTAFPVGTGGSISAFSA